MKLSLLDLTLGVCRLPADSNIPDWASSSRFFSVSKTDEEFSVVCEQKNIPDHVQSEKSWKVFKVQGPLDFGLTGILSSIASPLAESQISIFAISTFDTDYVLVKSQDLNNAKTVLLGAGFEID